MRSITIVAAALQLGSRAYAQIASSCPETDVCYSLNVPDATASSGSGDIYFQISAPTTYEYVALGQGTQMDGANMFVMYTSASGTNVTLSPRLGTGHVQPQYDDSTGIYLLDGTGVNGSTMVANVRCMNCQSWDGGSMDFTGSSTSWIYASKTGSALNSDDKSADIDMHDGHGDLTFDLTTARGGSSANPFVAAAATTTNSSSGSSGVTSSSSGGGGGGGGGAIMQLAHGALACIAWVAIFPIGGILMRVASFTGLIWVHAALQIFGYAVYIAAAGLGIYIATNDGYMKTNHAIIGVVLLGVFFFQPASGWLHHVFFKKNGGRGIFSYWHLFIGRGAIILGIINGGLGLQLAGVSRSDKIAYGVCAGFIGVVYLGSILYGETNRNNAMKRLGSGDMTRQKDEMSQREAAVHK
ncbi:CBD9-like protein [Teratosphaeria nubilosa]|uniref:CBD9-like protein n=1 Tax=Teratosphaeria nubilosa TaxID=161662 RepID=A0A6G1KX20_9PEZI|nr:CBD9-like protein [Teratosphaeria nubilosa]